MLHMEMRQKLPMKAENPYQGITMIDHIDRSLAWTQELKNKFSKEDYLSMVDRKMKEFDDYIARGGVMSPEDMVMIDLIEL